MSSVAKEAIEHVTEAENTVAKIRQDANEKLKEVEKLRDEEINKINDELQAEIQNFKKVERQKFEEKLENKIQTNKKNVGRTAEEYAKIYSEKQSELSDYIVKEVLDRYGN